MVGSIKLDRTQHIVALAGFGVGRFFDDSALHFRAYDSEEQSKRDATDSDYLHAAAVNDVSNRLLDL